MNYLNSEDFTKLFSNRKKNHEAICLGLQQIVDGVSRKYRFISPEEREDMTSATLVYAIGKIGKFDPKLSDNAFSYYTQVVITQLNSLFGKQKNKAHLHRKYLRNVHGVEDCGLPTYGHDD